MHLQQHRALQRREPVPRRQPAFIPCTWVNHREECLALFSSRGQNTLKRRNKKPTGSWQTDFSHTWKWRHRGARLSQGRPWLDRRAWKSQARVQSTALCSPIQLARPERSKRDGNLCISISDFHFCFPHDINRRNKHLSGAPESWLWAPWTTPLLFPW